MAVVKTKKIPKKQASSEDLLASFCYHFPQYTFTQARKMPYRRVIQMLKAARREEAIRMYNFTRAIAAPNTKNGSGIKQLLDEFNAIMNE